MSAALGQHVLEPEQRVVGDVEAEHLALEGEQVGLVPLAGRDRRRDGEAGVVAGSSPNTSPNRSNWPIASLRLMSRNESIASACTASRPRAGVPERVERAGLDQRLDRLLVADHRVDLAQEVVEVGERALLPAGPHDRLDDVVADVADRGQAEPDVGADRR